MLDRENPAGPDVTFEQIERAYYSEHYGGHVDAQNERNARRRHTERNRTVEDLLKNNKTCPEETIFQIGTMEESVPPEVLLLVVQDFTREFERRFGANVHIMDWALHLDEVTPHIHERHVFDCENQYGELCPQQEKALELLEIPLPEPDKPKGRRNNRKQTFDAICRTLLHDIARQHGLQLDEEPSYGGRAYLEKQDYILMKQKEQLAAQERQLVRQDAEIIQNEQRLEELTLKVEDVEALLDEVSEAAYEKTVETVSDQVRQETQQADLTVIENFRKAVTLPGGKNSPQVIDIANKILSRLREKLIASAGQIAGKVKRKLLSPASREAGKAEIRQRARASVMGRLEQKKEDVKRREMERQTSQTARRRGLEDDII